MANEALFGMVDSAIVVLFILLAIYIIFSDLFGGMSLGSLRLWGSGGHGGSGGGGSGGGGENVQHIAYDDRRIRGEIGTLNQSVAALANNFNTTQASLAQTNTELQALRGNLQTWMQTGNPQAAEAAARNAEQVRVSTEQQEHHAQQGEQILQQARHEEEQTQHTATEEERVLTREEHQETSGQRQRTDVQRRTRRRQAQQLTAEETTTAQLEREIKLIREHIARLAKNSKELEEALLKSARKGTVTPEELEFVRTEFETMVKMQEEQNQLQARYRELLNALLSERANLGREEQAAEAHALPAVQTRT